MIALHGPFGSGKSQTLVALVHLLAGLAAAPDSRWPGARILLAAHTNVAVDRVLTGLLGSGFIGLSLVPWSHWALGPAPSLFMLSGKSSVSCSTHWKQNGSRFTVYNMKFLNSHHVSACYTRDNKMCLTPDRFCAHWSPAPH